MARGVGHCAWGIVAAALLAACGSGEEDARTKASAQPVAPGPDALLLDYSWPQVEAWLKANDYPVWSADGSCAPRCTSYRAEGNRLLGTKTQDHQLIFEFRKAGDSDPPICLTYFPSIYGDPWEVGVERLLGAQPTLSGALDATNPACRAVDGERLACSFLLPARGGRRVPVEIDVKPKSARQVWGLRLGPCAAKSP